MTSPSRPSSPLPTPLTIAPRHLLILLFASERAWAHSQLLKSTLSLPTTSPPTAHRLAKRLSRALAHAAHLQALVSDAAVSGRLSVSQRGQVAAYFLVMKGSLAFERAKHEEGLEALSVAWELLGKLAETAESAGEEALMNEVIDEVEPMLRFCAYSLQKDIASGMGDVAREVTGAEGPKLVEGWAALLAELEASGGREKRETIELSWRGREIPVRNVELVGVVAKVTAALKTLENDVEAGKEGKERKKGARKVIMGAKRMATYDRALLVLSEGEEVARQLVEDNKVRSSWHSCVKVSRTNPLLNADCSLPRPLAAIRSLFGTPPARPLVPRLPAPVHPHEA